MNAVVQAPHSNYNIAHLLRQRETGGQKPLAPYSDYLVRTNLTAGRMIETLYKNDDKLINSLDTQENFAAATSLKTIRCWDLNKRQCLWTHTPTDQREWFSQVKISGGKVICTGIIIHPDRPNKPASLIRILDAQTGLSIRSIIRSRSVLTNLLATNDEIIGWFNDAKIVRWTLDGEKIGDSIEPRGVPLFRFLLASDDFIVFAEKYTSSVHVYHKKIQRVLPYPLNFEPSDSETISSLLSVYLHKHLLFCGFMWTAATPDCCAIDLNTGKITSYRIDDVRGNARFPNHFKSTVGIAGNERSIFLGSPVGKVVAVDRTTRQSVVLGALNFPIKSLEIKNDLLVVGGDNSLGTKELKFWDTKTLTQLGTTLLPETIYHPTRQFTGTKIVAACGTRLIVQDYLCKAEES